jgi:hypothetical protein
LEDITAALDLGEAMTNGLPRENILTEALSIIEDTPDIEVVIGELRELLNIDHIVYYLPKPGAPYVRLTYPDTWIKRYLQKDYGGIDPISREGFE